MFPLHDPITEVLRSELSGYDDLTASLLARRNIFTKEDAEKFMNPSYDTHLHDPFLMTDMRKAAERLSSAIISGEKIAVWSDYDCDGIPGGVLMHDFLKKIGANFENYIPHRHDDGYGMNIEGIEALASSRGKAGTKLIVTVDSGITDIEPIARANELGIEVIVTDHHMPKDELPNAFAVVNPHAHSDEKYPFRDLCGAGVAWKLVCATLAIEPTLRKKVPHGWEKWLLDMVGLATIADMVPLIGENRVLATYGLMVMRKSPRIGFQKLCKGMRLEQRSVTEDDVGFMIAPRVNAASRIGDARDALCLFTTTDENEAEILVKKLEKANRSRRAEAGALTRAVHARISEKRKSSSDESWLPPVIALGDPQWRPSLLGIVANTIADEYERPVFLWGREGNMRLKGSARSGGTTNLFKLMSATKNVFTEFGGHASAGGFTVQDTEVFFLEDRLVLALREINDEEKTKSDALTVRADAIITPEEATYEFLSKTERLSPFGIHNPKPVFLLRDVITSEISYFGKGKEHLKLKIHSTENNEHTIDSIAFFIKGPIVRTVKSLSIGSKINILAHLERDTFSRRNPVRLRLLDMRLAQH